MTAEVEPAQAAPLSQLQQARELLEASRDLSEVKAIRDVALAAQEYARARKLGAEAEHYAAEITTRAERRIGQLLAQTPKAQPGPKPELGTAPEPNSPTPRQQAGKKLSARSQQLAEIPDDEFERHLEQPKISAEQIARKARQEREREERQRRAAERAAAPAPAPGSGLHLAYADPPYLGQGSLYSDHPEARQWDDPAQHRKLIEQLQEQYPDGWALSASSPSLQVILPMCPDDVRIGAWVKPFAAFKRNVRVAYTWEPVIWRGGRLSSKDGAEVGRDHLSQAIMMEAGLTGAKPPQFCRWVLMLLGFDPACDVLDDLFPGTGIMAETIAGMRP